MGKIGGIWVIAEQDKNRAAGVSLELLTKARDLAQNRELEITTVLLGSGLDGASRELINFGADMVIVVDDTRLMPYQNDIYALVLENLLKNHAPEIVLWGATPIGSELAPTIAARLNTGLAAHCVDLKINNEGKLVAIIPALGGAMLGEILCPVMRPQMASVKPGVFSKEEPGCAISGKVYHVRPDVLDSYSSPLEIIGTVERQDESQPIEEAELVVAGGYGIGSQENWQLLEEFADRFSGVIGCTRPALDAGWINNEEVMIGTSGCTIRPKLYLGFGISGATHHITGMKDAGIIISINNDSKANIFKFSDYKVVADAQVILKALFEEMD